jgi:hypothetical protein
MKLHTFLQNVSECTKLGGYFIGTCFDGARIFQALARLESGDEISVLSSGGVSGSDPHKIWSARKKYHQTEFEPDSSSIGYEIEVYQDTINKATREYLVNFDYLTQLLENYGFDLVSPEEAATTLVFPMPDGTATFDGMYHQMELDCKKKREEGPGSGQGAAAQDTDEGWSRQCRQEYGSALYMTPEEKQISFYNRYFIFRKNRNINAKQLKSSFLSYAGLQEEQDRAAAGGEDEGTASVALERIAKASRPIDVASKPAIAAHILEQRKTEKQLAELSGESVGGVAASSAKASASTMKIKPKPKKASGAATTAKVSAAAAAAAAAEEVDEEAPSAPIEQIEKKIQKRTKKAKPSASGDDASGEAGAAAAAAPSAPAAKPKRQTKKKTDL